MNVIFTVGNVVDESVDGLALPLQAHLRQHDFVTSEFVGNYRFANTP